MVFVRYVLPVLLVLGGILLVAIEPNVIGLEGLLMAIGAALSVLLLNLLFRVGAHGDRERDAEEAARAYFTEHGRWPDEER